MSEKVMLCEANKELPIGEYVYQMKYDGTRCIADLRNGEAKLTNRRGEDISRRYFDLDLKNAFKKPCIVDGEICVLQNGKPCFNLLQHREHTRKLYEVYAKMYPAVLYVFDILEIDGESLTAKPLVERLKLLKENYHKSTNVFIADEYENPKEIWEYVKQEKIEGVVAKQKQSIYEFKRSPYWIKVKIKQTADLDIVGFTSEKHRISALLTPLGKVNFSLPQHLYDFWSADMEKYAFIQEGNSNSDKLIDKGIFKAEVEFLELTADNKMRFPKLIKLWKIEKADIEGENEDKRTD